MDDFDTQIQCEELNAFHPTAEDYEDYDAEIN